MLPNPCKGICKQHPDLKICRGCYRSQLEIKIWQLCTEAHQKEIIVACERKARLFGDINVPS